MDRSNFLALCVASATLAYRARWNGYWTGAMIDRQCKNKYSKLALKAVAYGDDRPQEDAAPPKFKFKFTNAPPVRGYRSRRDQAYLDRSNFKFLNLSFLGAAAIGVPLGCSRGDWMDIGNGGNG